MVHQPNISNFQLNTAIQLLIVISDFNIIYVIFEN